MYRPDAEGVSRSAPFRDAESAIRGLTQDFCTAFNTGNYDQAAALFAADAQFMPPHRESFQGTKVIERALRTLGESGYQDLRLETVRVQAIGEMAIEIGRYAVTIKSGGGVFTDRGKYLRGWHRLGVWLITADCWSSSIPLTEHLQPSASTKVA
jgi:uncharacterized protein (TIGR02246 family)